MFTTTRLTLDCIAYGDGYGTPEQHAERCAELGRTAMCVTEHGNVSSHVPVEKAALAVGIKSVFGLEAYCAPGDMRETGNQRKWHQTILAMDQDGYINLNRMVTRAWAEDFYRWPTVLGANMAENQAGLIMTSGCADSLLSCTLLGGKGVEPHAADMRGAMRVASKFKDMLGDRYYLEVQQFPELERTRLLNPAFAEIGARLGIPLVATGDVHYPMPDDNEMQVILHSASRGNKGFAATEASWEYDIRLTPPVSDAAVLKRLIATGLTKAQAVRSILATEEIGQRCNVTLPKVDRLRFPTAPGQSSKQLVWDWIAAGWKHRIKRSPHMRAHTKEYRARIKYEMDLIEIKDFNDYFLMLSDMVRWAKEAGIPVGPARGSAAASLVCWLLRITEVNPMLFPVMLFERFIDINRTDVPDVDLDFADDRRDEIRLRAIDVYGADHVANIGTFTKYKGKNSLDDVGRVYGVPGYKLKIIKDLIVERSGGDSRFDNSLEDTVEMFPQAKAVMEEYPKLYNAYRLEGNMKGMSVHAAGLVISNDPINDTCAMYTRESQGRVLSVLAVNKYDAEYLNLMKADFLSLKTMGMIRVALDIIGMDLDDMYNVDLNDRKVIQAFKDGDVVGIFQFWGGTTRIVNHDVKPDNFLELCDINALARPGPLHSGSTADYIDVKHGKKEIEHLHPIVDRLTALTKGQIIYQEQILSLVREVGDFPWTHAQEIRKIISLKKGEAAFNVMEDMFHEGSARLHNMSHETSVQIWRRLVTAGTYAFCMTGDTVIQRGGANQYCDSMYTTLGELYEAQESRTPMGDKMRSGKGIKLQQMDDDGRIRPRRLLKIGHPVSRPIIKVTTVAGRVLRMSREHRVLTDSGYVSADLLVPGMNLVAQEEKPAYINHPAVARGIGKSYVGKGVPAGPDNPAWIDGRTGLLRQAQDAVRARSKDACEWCHKPGDVGLHTLEFAHIMSLDDLGGDMAKRHSTNNLLHLCNSCHKKMDYTKGERVKRDTCGRPTTLDAIGSVEDDGEDLVYDVYMDATGRNYIGNGIVQHNNAAHCVSYSMLAYWTMWLKVHYPVAFYTACLQKYDSVDKDDQFFLLRDAVKHNVRTLPPHVDRSEATWSCVRAKRPHVDGKDIRAGFKQIHGIGEKMSEVILEDRAENGTFGSWDDLVRVKGIGPKTMETIKATGESDDPFGIYLVDKKISTVRAMLMKGELGPLPKPTHRADEIPTDGVDFKCIWLGIPRTRNPQDVVEDERARSGEDFEVIRKRMKRPDLVKKMSIECIDDSDRTVFLRVSRFRFPKFEKALWAMKLGSDMVLVRGVKRGGFGTSVHVEDMWVIEDDDDEEEGVEHG